MRQLPATVLIIGCLCSASVRAQHDPTTPESEVLPADQAEARRLFEQGRTAVEAENFAGAVEAFRKSLALSDRVTTAFNLGLALALANKPLESVSQLEAVLAGEHGAVTPAQRDEIQARLITIRQKLGTLRLRVYGQEPVQVEVDGKPMASAPDGARFTWSFLPGKHQVRARGADGNQASQQVMLRADTVETLILRTEPERSATDTALQAPSSPEDDVDGGDGFPVWAWVALGVLAVGSGIAIIAITQSDDDRPTPVATIETLQLRF